MILGVNQIKNYVKNLCERELNNPEGAGFDIRVREVYKLEGNKIIIGYENCLECGTCRLACPYENISWKYPRGGFGVKYRYG